MATHRPILILIVVASAYLLTAVVHVGPPLAAAPHFQTKLLQAENSRADELRDPDDSEPLLPLNRLPQEHVQTAVQSLADEGDRLAGRGQYREAIVCYSSALRLAPTDIALYRKRGAAYRQLGESQLADQDMGLAVYLQGLPDKNPISFDIFTIDSPAAALRCGAWAWLALAVTYCFVGFRQSREGGGTNLRLLGVAIGAAFVALLPLFVWLASLSLGHGGAIADTLAIPLTALSGLWMALVLRPPHRPFPSQPRLTLVEDSALLARVAKLAAAMRIAVPRVRLVRSAGGAQQVMAWAGGLPQPSVFVSDGLLSRLDTAERDAIIAHEMGHIANHSLWPLSAVLSMSCAVATLFSLRTTPGVALVFGYAFMVGLRRILSRPIEADCDRRAARAIGYRQTISALTKVHALQPIRNTGLLPLVAYAWATHPSREVRLTLLARAADRESSRLAVQHAGAASGRPPAQGDAVYTPGRFRLHRAMSWLGVALWIAGLSVAWWISPAKSSAAIWLLIAVGMTPGLLLSFSRSAAAKRAAARQRLRAKWVGLLQLAGFFLLIFSPSLIAYSWGTTNDAFGYVALVVALVLLVWFSKTVGGRGLERKINEALRDHHFADALTLGRENRKKLLKKPLLRYNVALVEALHGDRALGIAEFEELRRKYRSFALPSLTLFMLYFEQDDYERALEMARLSAKRWPKDPQPAIDEARVLRQLGRLDEAQAAIDRALRLDPQAGAAYAIAAGLSLDRGDIANARELTKRAAELDPGGLVVVAAEAEVALVGEDFEIAKAAVERAVNIIKSNPFALCGVELARLEQKLVALEPRQMDAEKIAS